MLSTESSFTDEICALNSLKQCKKFGLGKGKGVSELNRATLHGDILGGGVFVAARVINHSIRCR